MKASEGIGWSAGQPNYTQGLVPIAGAARVDVRWLPCAFAPLQGDFMPPVASDRLVLAVRIRSPRRL